MQKLQSRNKLGAPGSWRKESLWLEWKRVKTDQIRQVSRGQTRMRSVAFILSTV